jgi:NADH:ubiquinone oxidoreductase subunit 5 (subunit L)/multisubunit Na+/H+ antiporter MnhA subunit
MNKEELLLILAVFVPTLGAFLLPLLGRLSVALRNAAACFMVVVALVCSVGLLSTVLGGAVVDVRIAWPFFPGCNFVLHADALAVFMAIVSSLISAIIALYSVDYISHYGCQNEYYMMVVLFLGAMMGLVYSGNLILLYIFWEITAIASWRLIGFFREKHQVVRADKAFLVTVFGALAMLLGFVIVYTQNPAHTFDLIGPNSLKGYVLPSLAVGLILLGILSKSATFPLHTWLPDAGVAPSPVTALLHAAVLVKIGVYVFARLFLVTFVLPTDLPWHTIILWIAATSALVSAGAALIDTDLKRIIAYSTVSQIAFIFLGLASGAVTGNGTATSNTIMGVSGALLYILMHGLAKGGLFLCAGIVEQNAKTKDITQMGGLIKTMPWTAFAFAFCAFSVMGIPPFGGFFSKFMVLSSAIGGGQFWISMTFLVGAFMTIIYLLRVFNMVFLGEPKKEPAKEGSRLMVACVVLLAVLSLAAGLFIHPAASMARTTVEQMLGMVK